MASLNNLLPSNTEFIELGEVKTIEGNQIYIVTVAGVDRRALNTSGNPLVVGAKVLISKLSSGERFITQETGLTGNSIITKEVYTDG